MDKYGDDIAKYHDGRLTPAERHALEKKALSDPFLADALEGAGQISGSEFSKDVESLLSKTKGGAKPLFTPLRIAAGVVLLVATGWIALYVSNNSESKLLTQAEQKPNPATSQAAKDSAAAPAETPTQGGEQDEVVPKKDQLLSLNKPKNEKESAGPAVRDTKPESKEIQPVEPDTRNQLFEYAADSDQLLTDIIQQDKVAEQPTESLAAGQTRATEEAQAPFEERRKTRAAAGAERAGVVRKEAASDDAKMSRADVAGTTITGKVTLADDGIALPGVNVRVKGSSTGTVTDLNGSYTIEAGGERPTLVFSFIGLQTKEATPAPGSNLDVALTDDVSQLSEVVVTGKKIPADLDGEPVIKLATPVGGLRAYDKYLYSNLTYPQQALASNVKGRVSIQFTVGIDGSLNEFTVMKSLGFGCDEEVIRLVKEGPKWSPTTENDIAVESLVRVRMKFDAAKEKRN